MAAPTHPPARRAAGAVPAAEASHRPVRPARPPRAGSGSPRRPLAPARTRRGASPSRPGRPMSSRTPTATSARGTRNRPQPRGPRATWRAPRPAGPSDAGVEGQCREDPERSPAPPPRGRWRGRPALRRSEPGDRPSVGALAVGDGGLATDGAADRPRDAGRAIAGLPLRAVTCHADDARRVGGGRHSASRVPVEHRHTRGTTGRTTAVNSHDHRDDHRPLAGALPDQLARPPRGPPGSRSRGRCCPVGSATSSAWCTSVAGLVEERLGLAVGRPSRGSRSGGRRPPPRACRSTVATAITTPSSASTIRSRSTPWPMSPTVLPSTNR